MGLVTIVEKCRISPPPNTVGERSLPLTFFDIPWMLFLPTHQLLFYEFHSSKSQFIQTVIPNLKHSLSIALQHFFPFAGNLIVFPAPAKPEIRHVEGDSIALAFAEVESTLDFNDLIGNHPRECNKFHPLVPQLEPASKVSDFLKIPLFCVQVTFFENSGFAIGITNNHTLCDASTMYDFLRAWASITKYGTNELFLASGSLPLYDRAIKYPKDLDDIYLNKLGIQTLDAYHRLPQLGDIDKVRATFVLPRPHINLLKKWVLVQLPTLEYTSSFTLACAYVWSSIAKSRVHVEGIKGAYEVERFGCLVDWRVRMDPPVPQTYFGNCVGLCEARTQTSLLIDRKGFVSGVDLIGRAISKTVKNKQGMLKDAETWLDIMKLPVPTIVVSGTPKLNVYDVDFGWGSPRKCEVVSLDYNDSISVNVSKEAPEDLEIGLCLPAKQMDAFIAIFKEELESIVCEVGSY